MKKNTGKQTFLRVLLSIFVITAVFIGTILLIPNQKLLSGSSFFRYIGKAFGRSPAIEGSFLFDANLDNMFSEINGMLLITSKVGYQLFDRNGNEIAAVSQIYSSPAVSNGNKTALLWDIGGKEYTIISSTGDSYPSTASGMLISAAMNESGFYTIAMTEDRYKGSVTVYNNEMKPVYKWNSGEGYIVDCDISASGGRISVVTLTGPGGTGSAGTGAGSRIISFSLDSEQEKGTYVSEDNVIFDLEYISENTVCALSQSHLSFLDSNMAHKADYSFPGEYLKNYSLDGDGFAVLLLGKHRTGGAARLATVDEAGNETGSLEISGEVLSISAKGKYIVVAYPEQTVIYRSNLSEYGKLDRVEGVRRALMNTDGTAYIITGNRASIFSP
ncbi:MAG: hypothetical protein GX111_02175 [Clostridiales bacterium]|jgi:hypothetical protein|nr:hypothetical protein [Clostridiales bacterium]